jgi:hypothetical protein
VWLCVLALAVALVGRLIVQAIGPSGNHPSAASTKPPTPSNSKTARTVPLDVLRAGEGMWVVSRTRLSLVRGTRIIQHTPLTTFRLPDGGGLHLALDAQAGELWVVTVQTAPTRMLEFDLSGPAPIRDVRWGEPVTGAVAFDGHLYLSSDLGIADLAPGHAHPAFIPGLRGAVGPIAVDPSRRRLIAADLGSPTEVLSYRPGQRPFAGPEFLPLTNGTLTVVGGVVWIGGLGRHGAVIARLDPHTLRPLDWRRLGPEFGRGAVVVGGGERVLWVSSTSDTNFLACVHATTGEVQQRWRLGGVNAVASDRHGALAATSTGLLGLVLSGCRG